ncbi:carnosine synthase 1-like [Mizuhopecten yessoensis]|uniref:Carnosine synthase 1 n=1 Tax=Mizuhopecten yessoensis TaxID=6573 RepID=A0A210QTG3_MIZYE|nr:carnosine synthase 1-like [Mizuhopecten yessoensis]OWF52029.1 Carnosine synthase 1 [Mizuhopecten yessoensis]
MSAAPSVADLYDQKTGMYTTAVGSYRAWSIDVDLGPPCPSTPVPLEDVHVLNYYDALQYSLYENNFPETVDRTDTPRREFKSDDVTIALLSSPVECFAILLAGGQICPRDMLLVMSSSWVTKVRSTKNPELFSLYVHKAITMDVAGQSFLDTFNPPRRVTYFLNYFTRACTDGQRSDGETLESGLDCPMSSSLNLVKNVDDKVWTRTLLANVDADYPETLAFTYKCRMNYDVASGSDITVIKLDTKTGTSNQIHEQVQRFLNTANVLLRHKVVVKPSGVIWHGSLGVTYHARSDVIGIVEAVVHLLKDMEPENGILVETFYAPPIQNYKHFAELSFRLRSTVCRGFGDRPITTTLICGVGPRDKPINGDNTIPQTFDTTLRSCGVTNAEERKRLRDRTSKISEDLLGEMIKIEKEMTSLERGGVGGQTDIVGLDFVLGEKGGILTPIAIEVNSHDCTINCQLFESMNHETQGCSVGPLVENMAHRSQRHIMQGKTILVIGAGGFSKRFIWKAARDYGIKVFLVNDVPDSFVSRDVDKFIQYDFSDHMQDDRHARNIIQLVSSDIDVVDGCCTFWEDCGPLAANICDKMHYSGASLQGALIAKKKSSTQQLLRQRTADIPHFPRTYLYTGRSAAIRTSEEIDTAATHVRFPAVLKLEYGSSAIGVKLVNDEEECRIEYEKIRSCLRQESDHPGIGLGYGNDMMLMEYYEGTEHDIDIIIYKRRLIAAFISDNGPTRQGNFTETAASMPTCLPPDKSGQLTTAAYQCCTEVGLTNGVFNVEMIMTPTGPKLLEINARMGGFYLRDWIKACYDVDLLLCSFMIAAGVKPILPRTITPRCHIMGVMCVPSAHRETLSRVDITNKIYSLHESHKVRYNELDAEESLDADEDVEEPFSNFAVVADDLETAKSELIRLCSELEINNSSYDVPAYVSQFHPNTDEYMLC